MKKENTAKGLMAVAMFVFGTLAPFVRNINISSGELALYRAIMAAALVSVIWFNEGITVPRIIGGLLILEFTLLSELPIGNKK